MKARKLLITLCLFVLAGLAVPAGAAAAYQVTKVSGDNQFGFEGGPLREDFVVRVTSGSRPVAGVPVIFTVIIPDTGHRPRTESILSSPVAFTEADGTARTRLNLGMPSPGELAVTAATRETAGNPAVFGVTTRPRHWFFFLLAGIVGGLGIFLFGMFHLNEALQRIAGNKLREVLITLTSSPVRGVGTGLFVTLFNQSSSATTLLEVSLVSAGLLSFFQTMAVTMGAEVGSTVTAQLVAFRITEFAVFIAGIGFFISFFAGDRRTKSMGNAILGFGLLFLGVKIMSDLVLPLKSYGPFLGVMESISNPMYGILIGMGFTLLVHSSGATAGVVIALALAGAISLPHAILVNLGASIGTCATAMLGAIGRGREGKRVALWHVLHQTAGVLLIYPFMTVITYNGQPAWVAFITWFTQTFFFTTDLARQIAMAATLAAVLNALVFFPFLPAINRLLKKVYPARDQEKPFGPVYIDDGLLDTPALAIEQAHKEVVREAEIVLEMLQKSMRVFEEQDLKLAETVSLMDIRADILRNAVVPYLSRVAQNAALTEEQSLAETKLLYIASDIEAIGDIVDKNIMPLARKKIENNLWFSDEGWKDIIELHGRVAANLVWTVDALKHDKMELAQLVVRTKSDLNIFESELRKRHIGRLQSGLQETLETSSVHLDLIDHIKRINSLAVSVCHTLLGRI